jgi:hypothetical protein
MGENDVLDAEYRAFVRQLHAQTIGIVAEVDRWWMQVLYPELSSFTAGVCSTVSTPRISRKRSGTGEWSSRPSCRTDVLPRLNSLQTRLRKLEAEADQLREELKKLEE